MAPGKRISHETVHQKQRRTRARTLEAAAESVQIHPQVFDGNVDSARCRVDSCHYGVQDNPLCFTPLLTQELLQDANTFVHMLFLQQERRKESQYGVLGAVEQHALTEGLLHDGTGWGIKLQALNQAPATRFPGDSVAFSQQFQLLLQVSTDAGDVLQQPFFFYYREILQRDTAGERAAAEGGSVLPGGNRRGEFLFRQERTQRQTGGDRLGDGDDVRDHTKGLECEDGAGASQAALDFVENKSGAMMVSQPTAFLQKFYRALVYPAFAEDRLEHDGAGIVIDGSPQSFSIVASDEGHFVQQGFKTFAVLVLSGERHGAKGAAVIRALQGHQAALRLAACAMSCQPRQLNGAFDRFGPAIGEESALQSREAAQPLCEQSLIFVVIKIREVNGVGRLLADSLKDSGVGVAQSVHTQTGNEIQVAFAVEVKKENALAAGDYERIPAVGLE